MEAREAVGQAAGSAAGLREAAGWERMARAKAMVAATAATAVTAGMAGMARVEAAKKVDSETVAKVGVYVLASGMSICTHAMGWCTCHVITNEC